MQPERKARQHTRGRISKGKNSELSVNEGTTLKKVKQLPGGRATRSSGSTKPKAGTAVPEFIQGSSRSPLTGAVGVAGPSSRAGTDEGLGLKKPAPRAKHHKGCKYFSITSQLLLRANLPTTGARQGYIAIWGSHNKGNETEDVPETEHGYVFGDSSLFDLWVEGLALEGFPKENLKNISKGKTCQLKKVNGNGMCGWVNPDSHFPRHIYSHLPNEVAFWFHCPACGGHTNGIRKDTLKVHVDSCARACGIPATELLKDAQNNEFLQ
jgi:hypothetical protein